MPNITALIIVATIMFCVLGGVTLLAHIYNFNNIKSKTVGDGQHGTARFATKAELRRVYKQVPFTQEEWRKKAKNHALPDLPQGIIVGCRNKSGETAAMVDDADVHCMMVGAAGCGKTAYWLYPNLEYACTSGMSWLRTDTKGDLYRNYGGIAKYCYDYNLAVIDLRNPTKSDGNNLLHLVNKYMDLHILPRDSNTPCLKLWSTVIEDDRERKAALSARNTPRTHRYERSLSDPGNPRERLCDIEIQFEKTSISTKLKRDVALTCSFEKFAGYELEAYCAEDYIADFHYTEQTVQEMKENIHNCAEKEIGFSFAFPSDIEGEQIFEFVKLLRPEEFYC